MGRPERFFLELTQNDMFIAGGVCYNTVTARGTNKSPKRVK